MLVEAQKVGVADEVVAVQVVVAVAEEGADVVQQRRVPEELALLVAEAVQPGGAGAVEQLAARGAATWRA